MDYTKDIETYFEKLKQTIDRFSKESLSELMNVLDNIRKNGKKVFIMGNGGSAATASHFCCDFNKGISYGQKKMFQFICLNDNVATMMAYANDMSFDEVFVGPLRNFLQEGDCVIGISGSGNSMNVVKALEYANAHGAVTVGLTGYSGGKVMKLCQYNVHIPIDDMQITEDLHMMLDHCIMKIFSSENEIASFKK
jgi:D-sedoheptulose 7-phosphate isomerase